MEKITAIQAAKLLGISIDNLEILEKQGLIHSSHDAEGINFYSSSEISQIKSRRGLTIADEAAKVGAQIQRETVSSISNFRKALIVAGSFVAGYLGLVVVFTILFIINPLQTSDFFGYYYRPNTAKPQARTSMIKGKSVLAAATGPAVVVNQTSILADLIKPAAATSLVAVKAIDDQKYIQIVTNPAGAAGIGAQTGIPGLPGANGANGADGPPGLTGPQGLTGPSGASGTSGTNGSNGTNGTSVADILTTPGSLIIRNGANTTVPLSAGSNGQVLTISSGIPAWENSSGLGAFSTLVSGINTTALMQVGSGASLSPTGTGAIIANSFTGLLPVSNGGTGVSTLTADGVLFGNGTGPLQTTSGPTSGQILLGNAGGVPTFTTLTGDATITGGGVLTLKNSGTPGTYGSAFNIPVFTTDTQGRVSGVTNTAISGLTAANLTAGDFSSKINSGTYSINISGNAASATNFSGLLLGDVTGTQTTTSVDKIKGAVLGTTTATSGNLLIGSGTQWVTQALSNDATINSTGVLTLKNTGIAGTYGSGSSIPVVITDAQGRVTNVTNTTIAGLTNSNLSGSAGITNANLANSAITFTGNSGSSSTSLGGTRTIVGAGVVVTSVSGGTLTITGTEADTLASVTGRGATTTTALTLSNIANAITAGILIAAGGTINGTTIGATTPSTGVFTIVNGLTITNNGTNTLTIAAGKTLTVNKSITFTGTDGTSFTLPSTSDDIVGRTAGQTLTNKTIAAGSNTISGLTNSNLSGSAGITNANLANSSITANGNSGSASVSLGGGLTFSGSGITNITASGSTVTVTTTEADTLQSVFNRGNSIPTTAGTPANTINQATIAVGNIASTAQNNFSTLNLTNGGSGFLDVEFLHGMMNMQGMNSFSDDFTGRALDTTNKWQAITTSGGGNTCSSTFVTGAVNGILRFTTSGTQNRGCALTTQATLTNGFYQRGNNPTFETKVSLSRVAGPRVYAGFTNTVVPFGGDTNANTNHAYIGMRSSDTQWQCITDNGGSTDTYTSTGVTAVANTNYRLRVEVRNGTTPEIICTVDNGTTVTRVTSTATQPGVSSSMDIYIKAENGDGNAMTADWDYVRTWQDDPPLTLDFSPTPTASNADVNVPGADMTSSATQLLPNKVASDSGSLTDIVSNSISNFFKNLIEFFGNVIFHADVTFLGHTTFNKDTAGHALIKAGESEADINFDREYLNTPIVTANVNLVDGIKIDEVPSYAVYNVSTKGFKIKLFKLAAFDLNFSWVALAVNDKNKSTNPVVTNTPAVSLSPTPSVVLQEQVLTPTPETTLVPTPSSTASSSASSP